MPQSSSKRTSLKKTYERTLLSLLDTDGSSAMLSSDSDACCDSEPKLFEKDLARLLREGDFALEMLEQFLLDDAKRQRNDKYLPKTGFHRLMSECQKFLVRSRTACLPLSHEGGELVSKMADAELRPEGIARKKEHIEKRQSMDDNVNRIELRHGDHVTVKADDVVHMKADDDHVTVRADDVVIPMKADNGHVTVRADDVVHMKADDGHVTVEADDSVLPMKPDDHVTVRADDVVHMKVDDGHMTVGADDDHVTVGADDSVLPMKADDGDDGGKAMDLVRAARCLAGLITVTESQSFESLLASVCFRRTHRQRRRRQTNRPVGLLILESILATNGIQDAADLRNLPLGFGETPLVMAVRARDPDVVLSLLRHGADTTRGWMGFSNALEVLLFAPNQVFLEPGDIGAVERCLEYLLRAMASVDLEALAAKEAGGYYALLPHWRRALPEAMERSWRSDAVPVPSLQHLCRCVVRRSMNYLGHRLPEGLNSLPLPLVIGQYLSI